MLRAGPFSDERVARLANRRFINVYFDLADGGAAGDPGARKFVTSARPELAGSSVPTPPVLLMNAAGKVVAEISNYAGEDDVLKTLKDALDKNPAEAKPSPAEAELKNPIERAEVLIDLLDYVGAKKLLADVKDPRAEYLVAHIARIERRFDEMEAFLKDLKQPDLADDARMERAYKFWHAKDYKGLQKHLKDFPKKSNRYTEAQYYLGLAHYHLGDRAQALELWKAVIKECPQDPWIYRADWAYANANETPKAQGNSYGGPSVLKRIGYMGRRNPDL